MVERRRSERIFLRVPISVQAVDQSGQLFTEQTSTLEINRDGARIGLKNSVRLGDELRITNLTTGFAALFRVCVQCPQSYGGSPEWGVAASPSAAGLLSDFWGIVFEDLAERGAPHISALLACSVCGHQELVALSRPEYEILLQELVLPRICSVCHASTEWIPVEQQVRREPSGPPLAPGGAIGAAPAEAAAPSGEGVFGPRPPVVPARPEEGRLPQTGLPGVSGSVEGEGKAAAVEVTGEEAVAEAAAPAAPVEEAASTSQAAAPSEANRRVARRVPVGVPILIRTADGRTEETVTRDVSRTGLSFPTVLDLARGDLIEIVVGHGVVPSPTIQQAEVVWRRPPHKGVKALAGARFTVVR